MTAPQLELYVAPRAGNAAVIDRGTGAVVAWIVHDGDALRARRGRWLSEPTDTVSALLTVVSRWRAAQV